jgi:hypothetical protein
MLARIQSKLARSLISSGGSVTEMMLCSVLDGAVL